MDGIFILEQSGGFKYEPEDNDDVWARIDPTKFKIPRLETNGTLFEGGLNSSVATSEPSMISPGPDSPATLALSKKFEGLRHSSSSSFGEGESARLCPIRPRSRLSLGIDQLGRTKVR